MTGREIRKRVYKWLLFLQNTTYRDSNEDGELSVFSPLSLTPLIPKHSNPFEDEESAKMFYQNASKYFESKNISISDLNITNDNLRAFLNELRKFANFTDFLQPKEDTGHSLPECENYCSGSGREILNSYREVHGYISLVICIFGTIANIFNIIVLTRKDMCKAPINQILKWLAVADMFVMIEYIPFSTYMYLIFPGKRDFKYSWAVYLLFHMHFTQILHTISISLTVTLAVWRYIAIKHPHGRISQYILSHCSEGILMSFILSPILCFPTYFVFSINKTLVHTENNTEQYYYHLDANADTALYSFNFWVHSIIIKLLPCLMLTVISFVLVRVLCQAAKRKVKLKGYTHPSTQPNGNGRRPSRHDKRTDRTTMLLVGVLALFLFTEFPQGILGLLSGILHKCFFTRCYHLFGEVMDLLALINAAVGFVLYGLMSKQFRTNFKAVFVKSTAPAMEMTKITGVTTTGV